MIPCLFFDIEKFDNFSQGQRLQVPLSIINFRVSINIRSEEFMGFRVAARKHQRVRTQGRALTFALLASGLLVRSG